jgi:hypothetical protein
MRGRARASGLVVMLASASIAAIMATAMTAIMATGMVAQAVADVRVAEHQFELGALDGWSELPGRERGDAGNLLDDVIIVAGYRHAGSGALLAITRMNLANPRAWRDDGDFFAEVEAGIESTSARYQRFHRRQQRVDKVPALDLGFRRDTERGREVVLMRFLFFRRYTLALALRVPAPAHRRHERAFRTLVTSFAPYVPAP